MDGKTSMATRNFTASTSHLPDTAQSDMARSLLEQFRQISDGWHSFERKRTTGVLLASQWLRSGATSGHRHTSSNGQVIETRTNGMEIHLYPEDRISIRWRDGTTLEVEPSYLERGVRSTSVDDDGNVTFAYGDGTVEKKLHCGIQTIEFPDGSGYLREQNGKTHVWHANGESEHYDEQGGLERRWTVDLDGSRISTDENGHVDMTQTTDGRIREFTYGSAGELTGIVGHMGRWKREAGKTGQASWVNLDTGKVWSGEFTVDSHGNARYVPHKSNSMCTAEVLAFPGTRN